MLTSCDALIQEVRAATNLDETLTILKRRVKHTVAVDAFAVFVPQADAGGYALMASDGPNVDAFRQIDSSGQAAFLDFVCSRRELVILTRTTDLARFMPVPRSGIKPLTAILGTPLIHFQNVLGVLVACKQDNVDFDPGQVSFFVTVAAQLSMVIYEATQAEAVTRLLHREAERNDFIQGVPAAAGIAIGTATVLAPLARLETVPNRRPEDVQAEAAAFKVAIAKVQAELKASGANLATVWPDGVRELFNVYSMLLDDESLVVGTLARIHAGNWAPAAWRDTIAEYAHFFDQVDDPYLRAQSEDIRGLGMRVLEQIRPATEESRSYPTRCILVGDVVGIQEIAKVPVGCLVGILCQKGTASSHTAVVARALGIPAVTSLSSLPIGLIEGCTIVVDGDAGRIYLNPSQPTVDWFNQFLDEQRAIGERYRSVVGQPAKTADGVHLPLHVNLGLDSEISMASDCQAEGVGLYRTEFQFLLRESFPVEEEQYESYRRLLGAFTPRTVTIRTLDVGGDKILSYFSVVEDNPFLGVRGIRFSLAHPEIFMVQLRALLRANAGFGNLQVLFPMVAKVGELDEALKLLEKAHQELLEDGYQVAMPAIGVMIEVPSAVFLTSALAKRVDFLSIGTNDLAQYLLAADRSDARVTTPHDALHPAVLSAIRSVVEDAHQQNTPVTVCGELAGDPAAAVALLGLGVDGLSMSSSSLPSVALAIRNFTVKQAQALAFDALQQEDETEVRHILDEALSKAGILSKHPDVSRIGVADADADSGSFGSQ